MKMKALLTIALLSIGTLTMAQHPCENEYGSDSAETVKNLSLFNQYFQMKKYGEAYPYWKYLFDNAPCLKKRITYNAPTVIKRKMQDLRKEDKEAFEARLDGLVDTLLMSYEKRIYYWGSEGYVKGKYANDLAKLRPAKRDSALLIFKESVELEGMKTDDKVPIYYVEAAVKEVEQEDITLEELYEIYFKMLDIINYRLDNASSDKEKKEWNFANDAVNSMMKSFLECEKLVEYFKPKIDADKTDLALLKRASSLMSIAGCESNDFYIEVAELIYGIEPSSESALAIGKAHHAKQHYDQAIEFYRNGARGMEQGEEKAEVLLRIANIQYKRGNYASAKGYANEAIANDAANGAAYLIVAQYYANSASNCTADHIDGRSVFWAAVDKCIEAKNADPSVEEDANKLIAVYASKYPKQEDAFFKGFTQEDGSSYLVPCLGVNTIVRYKK